MKSKVLVCGWGKGNDASSVRRLGPGNEARLTAALITFFLKARLASNNQQAVDSLVIELLTGKAANSQPVNQKASTGAHSFSIVSADERQPPRSGRIEYAIVGTRYR